MRRWFGTGGWFDQRTDDTEAAGAKLQDLERRSRLLGHEVIKLRLELALVRQAADKSDHDATYWRLRAERFIDQVGLRERIIAEPTMTDPPPPAADPMTTVFSSLGKSEIHPKEPPPGGAAHAAPTLTGVDPAAAQAAVDALLAGISTP